MPLFILLTGEQAARVRGPSSAVVGAALVPVERQGGVRALPVTVLDDHAHAEHRTYLAALPQLDSDDPDFPPEVEEQP